MLRGVFSLMLLTAVLATAVGAAPAAADGAARTQVSKRLGPSGGIVKLGRGVAMYVPPGVMQRRGRVSITRLRGGRLDFHIDAPWSGYVAITLRRVARDEVVGHRIARQWLPEGRPGQRTVFVSRLSIIDTIKAKAKAAACFLTISRVKIVRCLAEKMPGKVSKEVLSWIAEKLGQNCAAAVVTYGPAAPIGALLDPACVGKAGEGEFKFPTQAPPTLPVTTNPGGAVQPPTVNPQQPAPALPPAPAPTWAEQQGSLGANTFLNPYNASGMGVKIQPYQWVQVSCKVHAPQIISANPDGYWYRIASAPWNSQYYAVANTFWNGDIPGHKPYTHNTDWAVPNC